VASHPYPRLTPLREVVQQLLSRLGPLPPKSLPIHEVVGLVAAETVFAQSPRPRFDNAAVDGYAVRASDTTTASTEHPVRLLLRSDVVEPGAAVPVSTGDPVPKNADAVVPLEDTIQEENFVLVYRRVGVGWNIRRRGEDIEPDQPIIRQGEVVRPEHIALLADQGYSSLKVYPPPRAAILVVGTEFIEQQAPDANGPMLYTLLASVGCIPSHPSYVPDRADAIQQNVRDLLAMHDLIVAVGGMAVSDRDHTHRALQALNPSFAVHGIAMRPGTPTGVFIVNQKPVFGLPGNPVAAFFAFEAIIRPAVSVLMGDRPNARLSVRARLSQRVPLALGYINFLRVRLEERASELIAHPITPSGSGILSSLTLADGYAILGPDIEVVEAGAEVEVFLL